MLKFVRHDMVKARAAVAQRQADAVRAHLAGAGYDEFIPHVSGVREGILLGRTEDSRGVAVPVRMPLEELAVHTVTVGVTGCGKSKKEEAYYEAALDGRIGVGVIDCKYDLYHDCLRRAAAFAYLLPSEKQRAFIRSLCVIDPFAPDALVPMNPFCPPPGVAPQVHAYEVSSVVSELFGDMGFQMQNILTHGARLGIALALSPVELVDLLQDETSLLLAVARCEDPAVKEFFLRRYPSVPQSSKDALITRLQSLFLFENFRLMLGADSAIDFRALFDANHPMLIFLGRDASRAPEDQVQVVANLILLRLFQGAFARGRGGRPYTVIADEFWAILGPSLTRRFESALASLRSYGVHLHLVMHQFSQVPGPLRDAIVQHCDQIWVFRSSSRLVGPLGDFLPPTDREVLHDHFRRSGRSPGPHEVRAQLLQRGLERLPDRVAYLCDRRKPYRTLKVRVPDLPEPEEAAGCSKAALDEFMERSGTRVGGYAVPKSVLADQLAARQRRLRDLLRPPIEITSTSETPDVPPSDPPRRRPRLG